MADENEIKTNITGDASQLNATLDEAQARIDAFFAKTAKGQQMSVNYAWGQALKEDATRTEEAKAKLEEYNRVIAENKARQEAATDEYLRGFAAQQQASGVYARAAQQETQNLGDAQARAVAMANTLRTGGVASDDAASALRNLGFSAEATAEAMRMAGFSAEEMGEEADAGANKATYSMFRARAAAQGFGAALSGSPGGLTFGMARMAAASSVLGPILEAAFPVIGLLVFIDLLSQLPAMYDKLVDKVAGWGKAQEQVFSQNIKDVTAAITRADQLAQRRAQDQGAEVTAETGKKSLGLGAEEEALRQYQAELGNTQKQLYEIKSTLDSTDYTKAFHLGRNARTGQEYKTQVPNLDNEEFQKGVDKQFDLFNHYLDDLEKKTGQRKVALDPIDWTASDTTIRTNIQKLSERISEETRKIEETQVDTTLRLNKIVPEKVRASVDEEIKNFNLAEQLKTATLDKGSNERIASVQRELDNLVAMGRAGTDEYIQTQIKLAQTTQTVHAAQFAEFSADARDRIDQIRQDADAEQTQNQRKLSVAIAAHGAESAEAQKAAQDIITARRAQGEAEIGQLRLVLEEAVKDHGLESSEARRAYGEITKAATKMADDIRAAQNKIHEEMRKADAEETDRATKRAVDQSIQAQKDFDEQQKIAQEKAALQEKAGQRVGGLVGIQAERTAIEQRRAMIEATRQIDEKFAQDQVTIETNADRKKLENLKETDSNYVTEKEALENKLADDEKKGVDRILEINRKAKEELAKLDQKELADREKTQQSFVTFWDSIWDKMLFRAHSFSQAMTFLWQDIAKKGIDSLVKLAGEFVAKYVFMEAVDALMHVKFIQNLTAWIAKKLAIETGAEAKKRTQAAAETAMVITEQAKQTTAVVAAQTKQTAVIKAAKTAQAAAAGASVAAQIAANAALAHSDVGTAAAVVFLQAIENIPFPDNVVAAPILADQTYTAGLPFAIAASAAGGWDLPGGGPFATLLHAHEMVLPAHLAENIRRMSDPMGSNATPGAPAHFHFHQGDVHALDGSSVGEVMSRSPNTFVKMVESGLRRGAFGNLKNLSRRGH